MSALDNRIAAQYRKLEVMDDRLGRLMSQRVEMEEKLASLLGERNRRDGVRPPCPDCESTGVCEEHPFPAKPGELTGLGRQSDLRPGFYEDDMP